MESREILSWQEYISIYGFRRDRDDLHNALLIHTMRLVAGDKHSKLKNYLPNYLGEVQLPSKTEQIRAAKEFAERYKSAVGD
jgi:hypothetical protein